ncbi:hypothetical protein OSB04_026407 [Centaurea solstitialis]|uniref:Myb/SANT-like domain-containing protein n=1 Tax=Centaurea solstitialis TaxID=347529 RepID=A0AA38W998_9ASTR|nr:hypothetical protein OSB04_026407 [Centaurea solstitialis]
MADRRNWTTVEKDLLITILQEIVAAGGRSDNGSFRAGTHEQIVLKMREKIPGINITSKHIHNKMKRLKDKYSAAYDMLNTSGFGWDDAKQCVTVDAQVLEDYLKKHPSKNYVANKPFPQYERLKMVFGKDRATGSLAESAADAMDHINLEEVGAETEEAQVPLSNPSGGVSESSIPTEGEASSKKRKRKTNFAENVVKTIEKGLKSVSEEMSKLVETVSNPNPALQTLPDELYEMGFDSDQCVAISMYFADNPNQLRLYSGMNATFKVEFVKTVLTKLGLWF